MTIRQAQARLSGLTWSALRRGGRLLHSDAAIKAVEYGAYFLLGAGAAGARVFGAAPFGPALVGALGGGGVFALAGAAISLLLSGSLLWALKYIAAAALVCAAMRVFKGTRIAKKVWFPPLVSALMLCATGFAYVSDQGWRGLPTLLFGCELMLSAAGAYLFRLALTPPEDCESANEPRRTVGVLLLTAVCLMTLSRLAPYAGISVGRAGAALLVMLSAFRGGAASGGAAGLALGLAMDAAGGGTPVLCVAYGLAGLLGGIFSKSGRVGFLAAFILTDATAVVWQAGSVTALYEAFVASVVFLLLPERSFGFVAALLPAESVQGGSTRFARERAERVSAAFRDLCETVTRVNLTDTNDNDIATVFDTACERVCRRCSRCADCWQTNYNSSFNAMNDAASAMLERRRLLREDLPDYFLDRCRDPNGFIRAANEELRALLSRRQFEGRLREGRAAMVGQYEDVAQILSELAAALSLRGEPGIERRVRRHLRSAGIEAGVTAFRSPGGRLRIELEGESVRALRRREGYLDRLSAALGLRLCAREGFPDHLLLLEAEPLAAELGIASMRRKGAGVSGDSGTYFKTDDGVLYVLLSDGMGSGREAARESGDAVRILERFIRAGVDTETALRLLCGAFLIKNEEDTGCATIDLMSIDLFTGDACMYKYGAAPSYIKQGEVIQTVGCESLAAGLAPSGSLPEVLRMRLRPGSFAIIASDGVEDDGWLKEAAADYDGGEARELARSILRRAVSPAGAEDDMTVLCVHVEARG